MWVARDEDGIYIFIKKSLLKMIIGKVGNRKVITIMITLKCILFYFLK